MIKQTITAGFLVLVSCFFSVWITSNYYYYSPFYKSIIKAEAVIHPTKNNSVTGIVQFEQKSDGLHINGTFSNLTPGRHGFHVHEWGDCSCADATCAGGHFNPTNSPHGGPHSPHRHIGDFGNIEANENGTAVYQHIDTHAKLNGPYSLIGRSLIIHADPDDLISQPSGNAGARIGCGVIGITQ